MGRVMSGQCNDLMLKYNNGTPDYFEGPVNNGGNNAMGGQTLQFVNMPFAQSQGSLAQNGSAQFKKSNKRTIGLP